MPQAQEGTQTTDQEALLTFQEAMSYLRVSRSTLYRLMWSGQLSGHKVGSLWRFYREDLQACVQTVSPPQTLDLVAGARQRED